MLQHLQLSERGCCSFIADFEEAEAGSLVDAVEFLAGFADCWSVDDWRQLFEVVDYGVVKKLCVGAGKLLQNLIPLQVIGGLVF